MSAAAADCLPGSEAGTREWQVEKGLAEKHLTRTQQRDPELTYNKTTLEARNPKLQTVHPPPCTLHPPPCTLHPPPCTLHSTPSVLQVRGACLQCACVS